MENSEEKNKDFKTEIDALTHEEMCRMWRFGTMKIEWRTSGFTACEYFKERLFTHFGGFTAEISKRIGWEI